MKKRLKIVKLFTEHPESVGESYIHHFLYACISGIKLIFAGIACVIHSIFPKEPPSRAIRDDERPCRGC